MERKPKGNLLLPLCIYLILEKRYEHHHPSELLKAMREDGKMQVDIGTYYISQYVQNCFDIFSFFCIMILII